MAETTADVRRDIEMTRERISSTLAQLEQKTNVMQIVRDHPWPAIAAAVGVGVLLSGTRADVKAAGATVAATKGASGKLGSVLDEAVANLMGGVQHAFQGHVDSLVEDIKKALGVNTIGTGGLFGAKMASGSAGTGGGTGVGNGSFAGSGASGSSMTATSASGAMGGASGSSTTGSWAPQSATDMSAAPPPPNPNNTPGTGQSTGGQNFGSTRAD